MKVKMPELKFKNRFASNGIIGLTSLPDTDFDFSNKSDSNLKEDFDLDPSQRFDVTRVEDEKAPYLVRTMPRLHFEGSILKEIDS